MATEVNAEGPTVPAEMDPEAASGAAADARAAEDARGPDATRGSGATRGPEAAPGPGRKRAGEADRAGAGERQLGGLLDEAQAAVSASANVLRDVRERYRLAHRAEVNRWEALQGALRRDAGTEPAPGRAGTEPAPGTEIGTQAGTQVDAQAATTLRRDPSSDVDRQSGSANASSRAARERDEALAARQVGAGQAALTRLDLALRSLENAWLFLDPTDETLVHDPNGPASAVDAQMRIIEAQEAERSRLAREVHDGPAQALSNAIFQVEVVERLLDRDESLARRELRALREMLARELRGVRAYLSQLRPPLLADLGLVGAVREAAEHIGQTLGVPVNVEVDEKLAGLPETMQVAILRIVQEALQNVRRHAAPRNVTVRAAREGGGWVIEVRDDGRGFEPERSAPQLGAAGRRRSFGLQFMRERAGLIGARFEVRSRPELGTVVRMVIPASTEEA